ncbi:sugar ABC transporter substrate-binding protein [Jiangella alba]|uniref:Carbohydrate ABC transporter substrate-binding protein, CUT1 family n=1 Tax=Jiangella alba TaxID=561176 RepID=A0A1H5HUX8_9ACTN|nr:extracellular solute-binding protein [Jiangella alba]SEE31665.1 carbohydrate ABC transporter substrate-binding protein, CUT1 family [Jiangella alba]
MQFPRTPLAVATAVAAATVLAACGSGFDDDDDAAGDDAATGGTEGGASLTVMIGSSGEAETVAVQDATAQWAEETGNEVEVIPAQDLVQQLQQGLAGGNPPDVFYVSPDRFRMLAEGGSLYPYGDQIDDADDIYQSLRDAFTYEDELYCAPKDGGVHALVIDTEAWAAAGLAEGDYPQDWDGLAAAAQALTADGRVGLAFTGDYNPVGSFMLAGGGFFVNDDQTEVTADTPENLATLQYLKDNMDAGTFAFAPTIDAAWGGEALGSGKSAMTIEGAWIVGALQNDFPERQWTAVPMPAGPGGPAATAFTNCWGIAADSENQAAAVDLVNALAGPEQQQTFAEAFGPIPSRASLADWNAETFPEKAAFAEGMETARSQVAVPGFESVLADFNTQLEGMAAGTVTPEQALQALQTNGEALLAQE